MKRIAATTQFGMALVAIGLLHAGIAVPQAGDAAADDAAATASAPEAKAAGEQARAEAARKLQADAGEFNIVAIEAVQWSDSSLGCHRPGAMYQQVIMDGYTVVLERQGKRHQVNVAGSRAVMCETGARLGGVARQPLRARGLDQMTTLARQDLAKRLRLEVQQIRVVNIEPRRWTDSDLNCSSGASAAAPAGVPAAGESVSTGYRLALSVAGRTYFYHTDLKAVRPCPPIEDQ
jgi:hypothetical protein